MGGYDAVRLGRWEEDVDEVRLPDLEVIRRYSIAVRREHAPVEEVLEALRADLEMIAKARGRGGRGASSSGTKASAARRVARPAVKTPARAKAGSRTKR